MCRIYPSCLSSEVIQLEAKHGTDLVLSSAASTASALPQGVQETLVRHAARVDDLHVLVVMSLHLGPLAYFRWEGSLLHLGIEV